jgi:hypothetical protein
MAVSDNAFQGPGGRQDAPALMEQGIQRHACFEMIFEKWHCVQNLHLWCW